VLYPARHLGPPHWTVLPGYLHRFGSLPSQMLAQAPVPTQAARDVPRGCPATVTHLPAVPGSAHAWHWPAQGDSQQTPSTHRLDAHCDPRLHGAPWSRPAAEEARSTPSPLLDPSAPGAPSSKTARVGSLPASGPAASSPGWLPCGEHAARARAPTHKPPARLHPPELIAATIPSRDRRRQSPTRPRLVIAWRASSSQRSFSGTPAWPGTFTSSRFGKAAACLRRRATSSWLALAFQPLPMSPSA